MRFTKVESVRENLLRCCRWNSAYGSWCTWCTNIEVYWDEICKYAEKRFGVILEADQLIRLEDEQIKEFYKYTPSGTPERLFLISLDEFL